MLPLLSMRSDTIAMHVHVHAACTVHLMGVPCVCCMCAARCVLLQAWAALEYLDGALGILFDYLKSSGLYKSTYVFLMSDNGSAMMPGESKHVSGGLKVFGRVVHM